MMEYFFVHKNCKFWAKSKWMSFSRRFHVGKNLIFSNLSFSQFLKLATSKSKKTFFHIKVCLLLSTQRKLFARTSKSKKVRRQNIFGHKNCQFWPILGLFLDFFQKWRFWGNHETYDVQMDSNRIFYIQKKFGKKKNLKLPTS